MLLKLQTCTYSGLLSQGLEMYNHGFILVKPGYNILLQYYLKRYEKKATQVIKSLVYRELGWSVCA